MSNYFIFIYNDEKDNERENVKMCRAILISEVIINRCIECEHPLNTSKLQKILYYMQKEHLKRYGKPMFDENIIAWECGPAIKEVNDYFKEGALGFDVQKKYDERIILLESHNEILSVVLDKYGKLSPFDMVQQSRKEKAWIDTWKDGDGKEKIIDNDKILEFIEDF